MTDIPHFDLPFRITTASGKTKIVEVEQDSYEDVAVCLQAALRTEKGFRPEMPTFGVTDLVFQEVPVDTATLRAELEVHESRMVLALSERPDTIDSLVDTILIETSSKEELGG